MAFPFIVRQIDLPGRTIVLQGRSLPYQGVAWGGTMELDVSWFPGNPVASVQVIGPREKGTTIVGKWKDIFLTAIQSRALLANFPALTKAARPDATVRGGNTFKSAGSVPSDFAERARVLVIMPERGNQVLRLLKKQGFLTHPFSNHEGRVLAFLGNAGLSFLGDIPEADQWLDYVLRCYLTSFPAWGGDGGGWAQEIGRASCRERV